MTRQLRHEGYRYAYQETGSVAAHLPDLDTQVEKDASTAEWFALNAAHHALTTLMDALVVLHELTQEEQAS